MNEGLQLSWREVPNNLLQVLERQLRHLERRGASWDSHVQWEGIIGTERFFCLVKKKKKKRKTRKKERNQPHSYIVTLALGF